MIFLIKNKGKGKEIAENSENRKTVHNQRKDIVTKSTTRITHK